MVQYWTYEEVTEAVNSSNATQLEKVRLIRLAQDREKVWKRLPKSNDVVLALKVELAGERSTIEPVPVVCKRQTVSIDLFPRLSGAIKEGASHHQMV